jgi:hypothetical protein
MAALGTGDLRLSQRSWRGRSTRRRKRQRARRIAVLERRPLQDAHSAIRGQRHARGRPGFVAPKDRIAVFDNDGTLWVEQPLYVEAAFALDRVEALAADHPESARSTKRANATGSSSA